MNPGYPQPGPNGAYPAMNPGYPQPGPNGAYPTSAPADNSRQSNWGQAPHAAASAPVQSGYPGANQLPGSTPFPRSANGPIDSDPLSLSGAAVGAPGSGLPDAASSGPNDDFDPISGSVSSSNDDFDLPNLPSANVRPAFNSNPGDQEVPPVPFVQTPTGNPTRLQSHPDIGSDTPVALPQPLTTQNATDIFIESCSFLSGLKLQNAKSFESVKCLAPNALEVTYSQRFALGYNFWQRPENLSQLRNALRALCGGPIEAHFQLINDPAQTRGTGPTKAEASFQMKRQIYQNPLVQDAINLFQTDVKAVYDEPFPVPVAIKAESEESATVPCSDPNDETVDLEEDQE